MRFPSLDVQSFFRCDHGAVTLDWLALSSGLLLLAAALFSSAAPMLQDVADSMVLPTRHGGRGLTETAVTVPVAGGPVEWPTTAAADPAPSEPTEFWDIGPAPGPAPAG